MRRLEHAMAARVDQRALGLGITSPEQEGQPFTFAVQVIDDAVGEAFPALSLVRAGQAALDREHGIEQQYTLPRPRNQAAMIGTGDAEVPAYLAEDIHQ